MNPYTKLISAAVFVAAAAIVPFLILSPGANQETGLNADLGWAALGLSSTNSPNGWAQTMVDNYEGPMQFQPYMNGPLNTTVIMDKGATNADGCAVVRAVIRSVYPEGQIPSYEGDNVPHVEAAAAIAIFCETVGA